MPLRGGGGAVPPPASPGGSALGGDCVLPGSIAAEMLLTGGIAAGW